MPIREAHLRNLLRLFYAKQNLRRRLLLDDIRSGQKKADEKKKEGGGDFYSPFWADAKKHIAGRAELSEETKARIDKNRRRGQLYPQLTSGFLDIWNEKIRWRNEPFQFSPTSIKGRRDIDELGATVKVENVLSLTLWDGTARIIYPYFFNEPPLPSEGVRLGFWALKTALPKTRPEDLRIIDILRKSYLRYNDTPFTGDEEKIFIQKYKMILAEWQKLYDERH